MSDWQREVTEDLAFLPGLVKSVYDEATGVGGFLGKLVKKIKGGDDGGADAVYKGIYPSSAAPQPTTSDVPSSSPSPAQLSILSSSFHSSSSSHSDQSVMVFPDFKIVHGVADTRAAAEELVEGYLRPSVGRAGASSGKGSLKSWYVCAIGHWLPFMRR